MKPIKHICPKCHHRMKRGVAIRSTVVGHTTLHYGGPGTLILCWKCPQCGHSRT